MDSQVSARARKDLDSQLTPLRDVPAAPPANGWIKAIRKALGMNVRQLAARMNLTESRVAQLETNEVAGATTIRTLHQAAVALDCTLVYAFIPNDSLDAIVARRAAAKVDADLTRIHHTMALENQALRPAALERERQRMLAALLSHPTRDFWDD